MSDKPVEFGSRPELSPEDKANYDARIQQARGQIPSRPPLKRQTPVGHVPAPQMPRLHEAAATSTRVSNLSEQLQSGVQPRPPGSPVITKQTAQQLADMGEAMKNQPQVEESETPKKPDVPKIDEDFLEALDFGNVRNEAERIHNNKDRKRAIESRCEPMNFDDLLWKGEVQQRVPINPGVFEVTFKSINGDENLFIRRYMAKQTRVSDAHDVDIYQMCQLAISVVAIHGRTTKTFDPLTDRDGQIDDNVFAKKLKMISGMALPILADLSVNHTWFDLRVRRLINPDDLKNG